MQSAIAPETVSDKERSSIAPSLESRPVADVEALLASLPKFRDEEVQALGSALREDRNQRRSSLEGGL